MYTYLTVCVATEQDVLTDIQYANELLTPLSRNWLELDKRV